MMENSELTYTQAMTELETIVAKMESNTCDIDQLSAYTTRALELVKICKDKLFKTDKEVEKCLQQLRDTVSPE